MIRHILAYNWHMESCPIELLTLCGPIYLLIGVIDLLQFITK